MVIRTQRKTLVDLIKAGIETGLMKRTGQAGNYRYFYNNRPLNLSDTKPIMDLIQKGRFNGAKHRPLQTMQAALNLSVARAEAVKESLVGFAKQAGNQVRCHSDATGGCRHQRTDYSQTTKPK